MQQHIKTLHALLLNGEYQKHSCVSFYYRMVRYTASPTLGGIPRLLLMVFNNIPSQKRLLYKGFLSGQNISEGY